MKFMKEQFSEYWTLGIEWWNQMKKPYNCSAFCLEIVSNLQCREGEPRWSEADSLSWKHKDYSAARTKGLKFTAQSNERRKLRRESSGDLSRIPAESYIEYESVEVYKKMAQGWGKNPQGLGKQLSELTQNQE